MYKTQLEKTPDDVSGEIFPCLLNSIQEASKTVFDDKSDELLKFVQERSDVYGSFFERYGITEVFLDHIFTYQTVLIYSIQKNNRISNFKVGPLQLHEKDIRNQIGNNNFDTIKAAIEKNKQITHDRIISELTLGFWTTLFSKRYTQCKFQSVVKKVFKNCPKNQRNIKNIQTYVNHIRELRNRVCHYEKIIHYLDINQKYQNIQLCVSWISTDIASLTK